MTPTEFFYWLQGYIELRTDKDAPFTAEQAECIARHADLVVATRARDTDVDTGTDASIVSVIGVLARRSPSGWRSPSWRHWGGASLTGAITHMVASQFEHVIDPRAGDAEQQARLSGFHGPSDPHGGQIKC